MSDESKTGSDDTSSTTEGRSDSPRASEGRSDSPRAGAGRSDGPRGGEGGRFDGPRGPRAKRRRGRGRRKVCRFCADKALSLDYKWAFVLEEYVSERGRIVPSRTTGTCAKHQRRLKVSIKRARNAALLAYARS
jgi:small subunit ribosomal protein S18